MLPPPRRAALALLSLLAAARGGGAGSAGGGGAGGECNVTFFPDENFDGVNLPNQPVSTSCSTPAACAALCCAAPGCLFFTLNAGSGGRDCYLKAAFTRRANPGAVSGAVNSTLPPPPPPPPPPPSPGAKRFLDAVADCGCDSTGASDTTARLQACVDAAYGGASYALPRVPVVLPAGVYLVSDTLTFRQDNPGGDDGINVVPGRFLPHVFVGAPVAAAAGRARPVLRLTPSAPGFSDLGGASSYKPVVSLFSDGGEGVDMNNLFKGVDIDLTAPGNAGACGVSHPGAQGATVTDVSVRALVDTFACFCGMNGAGGMHANVRCDGARYGVCESRS